MIIRLFIVSFLISFLSFSQENETVAFGLVESVPVYPGCYAVKKEERRLCFQRNIQAHIGKNFRYPSLAQQKNIQGSVFVQFTIDKEGKVSGIRTRGPHPILEKEAARIISLLPRMRPGRVDGRKVNVHFSIPVGFKLQ